MNRFVTIMVSTFLFFGSLFIFSTIGTCKETNGNTLYVGGTGDGNYSTIQDAIDAASPGDKIFVYSGIYNESSIVINKTINLIGEDKCTTIINGSGAVIALSFEYNSENVLYIIADHVNISGFTIQNGGAYQSAGIAIRSNYNSITNNIITNNHHTGIYLDISNNNSISGNTIINNRVRGIRLLNGINIQNCNNIIFDNTISNNEKGISFHCSNGNIIYNNTINNNEAGISLSASSNNSIYNNIIEKNSLGIRFSSSSNNAISGNIIVRNVGDGISLSFSSNTTISDNAINNNRDGISINHASNNTVYNNNINNNWHGINIFLNTTDNIIYHNNFINNTYYNVVYTENNTCYNTILKEGNYWDNYTGLDKNNDGIGDEPYVISGEDNVDEYPLMMPYDGTLRLKEFYVDEGQLYTMLIIGMIAAILFCLPVGYIWYRKHYKKK